MRSQNIKYNSPGKVGGASCLALLLLTFLSINPISSLSAYADEADEASAPATQADIPSTIGISFAPAAGSTSLSPTTATGQSAQINVLATVNVQNSGGYSVYLKSNSQNLIGKNNPANVIPGISGSSTYANLSTNTWGYYAGEGSSIPEGATYKAVSVSGNGDRIAENGNSKIKTDTKNIMLSFAAKINDVMPADTYQNTVTMSVVSSPLQTTLTDITNMQDMTSAICKASAMYETKQLKDVRDGKYYWVTKLADDNCWMTQNLDLDLTKDVKLTADTSDVPVAGWTPDFTTATEATAKTVNASSQTETRSWSLGNVRITNPTTANDCGYPNSSAADCTSQFTNYATPTTANKDTGAHYILGNHYQWNTATAGTGSSITAGQAINSICPKGWKLPESNATTTGTFSDLINAYPIGSDVTKLTDVPLYFVRGGGVDQNTGYLFSGAGYGGLYWSSTPNSNGTYAYYLRFTDTDGIAPSYSYDRNFGRSVRCLAR